MTASDDRSEMKRLWNKVMANEFSKTKLYMDVNFPRTSYLTGHFLNHMLQQAFARRRCEDLLVTFVCTSTDILHLAPKIHREGPLWRIIRASMSLVGLVPPLPHQELGMDGKTVSSLLVDGGYTNQFPVEELHELGAGTVICAVACPEYEQICSDYGDVVQGGMVMLRRACTCGRRRAPDADPPALADIQERLMYLVDALQAESTALHTTLTLQPPIQDYGLLDFHKFEELWALGYKSAMPKLREWLEGDSGEASWVREIIATAVKDDVRKPSYNMVEYGGRRAYAQLRKTISRARQLARQTSQELPEHVRRFPEQVRRLRNRSVERVEEFRSRLRSRSVERDRLRRSRSSDFDNTQPKRPETSRSPVSRGARRSDKDE
eukprot:gnl/TRDRNA2_/TRDRNA2_165798_c1_seq1.p1 gnl/TRDRNA2_/TRDRNA2_165798_c1~~gnl/TRDRNA2_/TRDRNA2_165798_c1_seq1.p1  ORF type:complete len:434 (+),score=87.04 gnl/TRDRNA2_/TRDRNA2_165798_c1_seq1:168-1304(+)